MADDPKDNTNTAADGYYGEENDSDLDLSFLDEDSDSEDDE